MRALAVAGADLVVVPQAGSVGEWPEGLYADLDLAQNTTWHARQLFLQHRRPELYADWLSR